jgi:DNA-binding transcriptional LysR family regulator
MDRLVLRDLAVFETVARHRSFTGAAAELGVRQSSLSYAVTQLEQRLGIALLARTTRSVAPTDAGRQLLDTLGPALRDIEERLTRLQEMRETVTGTVRLTMIPVAFETIIRPLLPAFYARYPDVSVEISTNEGLSDIVAQGFDGGIRFGTLIEKDMIALPLTRSSPAVIAGSRGYFDTHAIPETPADLADHRCVAYRLITSTRLYRWPLVKGDRRIDYQLDGSLVFDDGEAIRAAVLDGLGLGFLFRSQVTADLEAGRVVEVLADWVADLPGFSLYYPSRRRTSPAFRALIDHLREGRTRTEA